MDVTVLMASGEADTWEGAADAVDDRGSLIILGWIEGDEVPDDIKTMTLVQEIPQEGAEPMEKGTTYQVLCQYAPGMWIKVEFE